MPRLKKTPAEAAATREEKARGKEEQGKKHSEETQRETNPCATMAKPAQSKKVTPAYEEFVSLGPGSSDEYKQGDPEEEDDDDEDGMLLDSSEEEQEQRLTRVRKKGKHKAV
ncbi:hypothetical protein L208DRAFT_1381902 [Tricholoma matsutake]|nr:hypothetical protein L208DRAFT_1381902 [Tricholoma matsutake 945]